MRIIAAILALSICIGCSRQEVVHHGNIAAVSSDELVRDAVSIMCAVYPPALSQLVLVQEVDADFGAKFVEELRLQGYAVAEHVVSDSERAGMAVERPGGAALSYLIDSTGIQNEIHISIHVGAESLGRLYAMSREGDEVRLAPLGFWSHLKKDVSLEDVVHGQ